MVPRLSKRASGGRSAWSGACQTDVTGEMSTCSSGAIHHRDPAASSHHDSAYDRSASGFLRRMDANAREIRGPLETASRDQGGLGLWSRKPFSSLRPARLLRTAASPQRPPTCCRQSRNLHLELRPVTLVKATRLCGSPCVCACTRADRDAGKLGSRGGVTVSHNPMLCMACTPQCRPRRRR